MSSIKDSLAKLLADINDDPLLDPTLVSNFRSNAAALAEALQGENVPVVQLADPNARQIAQEFRAIVSQEITSIRTEVQQLFQQNEENFRQLLAQNRSVGMSSADVSSVPASAPAFTSVPAPAPAGARQLQLQLQKVLDVKATQNVTFQVVEDKSIGILSENTQLLQAIGNAVEMANEQQSDVPENVAESLDYNRRTAQQLTNMTEQMTMVEGNMRILFAEIYKIRGDIQQGNTMQLQQGEQIQAGVVQANQGIIRVENAVADVNANVTGMRGEVSARFDQAAAQIQQFQDFVGKRFNDVIGEIHRIGTYNSPCELKYGQGYQIFFNSVIWCLFVFFRFLITILAYIREVYFEFKRRFLALLPQSISGVPLRWVFEMAFGLMEWGAILLILDKYIGPLIGIPDLASKFIVNSGVFIFEIFTYVFNIICIIWSTLTSTIKIAIIDLGNKIGLWDWFQALWSSIYTFFTATLAKAMVEAKRQVVEVASEAVEITYNNTVGQLPSVPDIGLYSALGWKKGGKGKKSKLYGGADIPPHLIRWMETAQKNNYLDIIKISSLLNEAVFYNVINYIINLQLGLSDPTFISFLSTNPENILMFQKNANHLYYVLKDNGIFEMTPRIRESSRVEMLSAGSKKTRRRFYKYKKNSSRKIRTTRTKKNLHQKKKFNKIKSKKLKIIL